MKRGFLKKEALQDRIEEAIPTVPAEPAHGTEKKGPVQAPRKCSDFHIIGHKQLQFPNHIGT